MKSLLFFFLLTLSIVACKKSEKVENTTAEPATTEVSTKEASVTTSGIPTFEKGDVNTFVASYQSYIETFKEAVASKDVAKLGELSSQVTEITEKGIQIAGSLQGEEKQKLIDFMNAKSEEFRILTTEAVK